MRDHVYSRDQLLGLRRLAKHSLADVTRRQVWSAGIGRERSRPRGRRGGKHQHTAAAHRSADRHLVTVPPQHVDAAAATSSSQAVPSPAVDRGLCAPSPRRQRHVGLPPPHLNFATLNIRSLRNKVQGVRDLLTDRPVDAASDRDNIGILCLTETWHEDIGDVPLKRLRTSGGLQVLERARPLSSPSAADSLSYTNHGGVAIVASTRVKLAKMSPFFDPQTFELLCARVTSCGASCVTAVVYRPGSEDVTSAFYSEFAKLLEYLASFASPFVITGDLNVHFERPNDAVTGRVNDLLTSYGATQHVQVPTHVLGGFLDAVITGDDCQPTDVKVDDPGLSDQSRTVAVQSTSVVRTSL